MLATDNVSRTWAEYRCALDRCSPNRGSGPSPSHIPLSGSQLNREDGKLVIVWAALWVYLIVVVLYYSVQSFRRKV